MKIIVKYICEFCQREIEDMPAKGIHSYKDVIIPYEEKQQFCRYCRNLYELSERDQTNYFVSFESDNDLFNKKEAP